MSQAGDDAMGRQNDEPFAARIHERHHHAFPRGIWIDCAAALRAPLVAIGERSFVTMVAVGDHQFFVRQR